MADNLPSSWWSTHASANNALGTSPMQVIGLNTSRVAISFHNPGTITAFVYSAQLSPAPSLGSLGGTYEVLPGSDRTIYGGNTMQQSAVNGPWLAFSASSSGNPLTIMEMVQ